jgi:hypothetical protein
MPRDGASEEMRPAVQCGECAFAQAGFFSQYKPAAG